MQWKSKNQQRNTENCANKLDRCNKELESLAYIVSHDLKAPLRGIGSLADWLVTDYKTILDEEGQEMLMLLQKRAQWMERMIDGILQYSRAGRFNEKIVPINLNVLIPTIVETLEPSSQLHINIQSGLPTIQSELTQVTKVFQNLIRNAIQFINKPDGSIDIEYQSLNHFWAFSVVDNGPGIDPKHHEKVFQIFQMLQVRDESESSGIGLSLVKKIVELNGGQVWLESEVGQGAKFAFTWPKQNRSNL